MSGKLKKCKICNKEAGFIYEDGVCGHCKHYSICKSCNKETHSFHMLENGICEYYDKVERKRIVTILLFLDRFGQKCLKEVKEFLAKNNLSLSMKFN